MLRVLPAAPNEISAAALHLSLWIQDVHTTTSAAKITHQAVSVWRSHAGLLACGHEEWGQSGKVCCCRRQARPASSLSVGRAGRMCEEITANFCVERIRQRAQLVWRDFSDCARPHVQCTSRAQLARVHRDKTTHLAEFPAWQRNEKTEYSKYLWKHCD